MPVWTTSSGERKHSLDYSRKPRYNSTMPATFYWLVGERVIGTVDFADPIPDNVAFFCTTCGQLWGRITSIGDSITRVVSVPCEHHNPRYVADWSAIPGSLVTTYPEPFWNRAYRVDAAPRSVLEREFHLHLAYLDRSTRHAETHEVPATQDHCLASNR